MTDPQDATTRPDHHAATNTNTKGEKEAELGDQGRGESPEAPREVMAHSAVVRKEEKEEEEQVARVRLVPPDGGWGWLVALASGVIEMLLAVMGPCFGILFSQYLLDAGTSSTLTAFIFNTQCFLWNASGFFVRPLSQEFSWRTVGMLGALVASVGFTASALSPAPGFLIFSFSILCGIGGGLVSCLCYWVVPSYFERRRGMANAIMMGGVAVGQIAAPPSARLLQDTYGYRGATLILSAIMLHGFVAASFFHPVEWHLKPSREGTEFKILEEAKLSKDVTEQSKTKSPAVLGILRRVAKSAKSDLGILRSPRALIVCLSSSLCINSSLNFLMMVPFAMESAGLSQDFAAWSLTVKAVSNLGTRLLVSFLADCSWFSVRIPYVLGFVLVAISSFVFPLLTSPLWIMVTMVVYGCGVGANFGLHALLMIDVVGLERLPTLFGTTSFIVALGFITFGPLVGVIRDASDSYAVSMFFLAGMAGVSVLLWMCMGAATRWEQRRAAAAAASTEAGP